MLEASQRVVELQIGCCGYSKFSGVVRALTLAGADAGGGAIWNIL